MMTESQALETLTREDPEAAGDARAALAWLTGDEGLETISLLRLQEFLWYALPVKWPMSTPGRVGVAKALGRLFLLAGLDRYAGVCSSAGTEKIITAYADGHEEGIAAYTEAIEESNAAPPDTELLAWGSVMGSQERAAYDACAAALELAFASGELSVGARGWRTKRVDIVNRWLTGRPEIPRHCGDPGRSALSADGAPGTDTWLGRISAERIDAWAHGRPGERSRLARGLIPRLLEPPAVPDDPLPTLRWLLGRADEGLRLTARHYIAPALVTEAVDDVRLARPARRHAPPGTRRVPAAHAARHGADRDGGHPPQPHQPGAHQDGQAHDGGPRRQLAYRHRRADRPRRRPAAGLLASRCARPRCWSS